MLLTPQPLTRLAALRIPHITHHGVTSGASPTASSALRTDPVPVRQFPQCRDHVGIQQPTDHLVFGLAIG